MCGKPIAASVFFTSVPSAIVGYLLGGIGVPFVTHCHQRLQQRGTHRGGRRGVGRQIASAGHRVRWSVLKPPRPPPCVTPGK